MKISYTKEDLRIVEFDLKQSILTGSITKTPITLPKEAVTVNEFKDDKSFEDGGFNDISF